MLTRSDALNAWLCRGDGSCLPMRSPQLAELLQGALGRLGCASLPTAATWASWDLLQDTAGKQGSVSGGLHVACRSMRSVEQSRRERGGAGHVMSSSCCARATGDSSVQTCLNSTPAQRHASACPTPWRLRVLLLRQA